MCCPFLYHSQTSSTPNENIIHHPTDHHQPCFPLVFHGNLYMFTIFTIFAWKTPCFTMFFQHLFMENAIGHHVFQHFCLKPIIFSALLIRRAIGNRRLPRRGARGTRRVGQVGPVVARGAAEDADPGPMSWWFLKHGFIGLLKEFYRDFQKIL